MAGIIRALVLPVARTLPWLPLAAGGTVGLLLVGVPRLVSGETPDRIALLLLRGAGLAFGLGLAFLMDDPARHTTAGVPVRRAVRAGLRVALVAPVAVGWWTAALLLVPAEVRPPVGDMTLEAAATAVLALLAGAAAVRMRDEPEPGQAAAAALLLTGLAAPLLMPDRWTLFVQPHADRWDEVHRSWAWLLAGAALVWAACLLEPVRRRRFRAVFASRH
ncbi:ABC transporter [Streptomyces ureilyticus]|uniref:ABC transporter n=1 Tax=Streptomyces ureilyticus TaxID=1775131 RepID=A0ABX0DYT5_9ACTN|nr:ABC transporter [Streptomyces ureilyticus]NGO46522.1 ABC transporter [Streptomyces ureilyticus]